MKKSYLEHFPFYFRCDMFCFDVKFTVNDTEPFLRELDTHLADFVGLVLKFQRPLRVAPRD